MPDEDDAATSAYEDDSYRKLVQRSQNGAGAEGDELLEKVDPGTVRRVRRERDRVQEWLGNVRAIPRFRTPLEKNLANRSVDAVTAQSHRLR